MNGRKPSEGVCDERSELVRTAREARDSKILAIGESIEKNARRRRRRLRGSKRIEGRPRHPLAQFDPRRDCDKAAVISELLMGLFDILDNVVTAMDPVAEH